MKKKINNFGRLADILFSPPVGKSTALDDGEFYFVQILLRPKDGHRIDWDNRPRLLRYHCVKSADRLMQLKPEITAMCDYSGARAYINPSPKNEKDVAALMLQAGVKAFTDGDYGLFKNLFVSACGQSFVPCKRLFVIDADRRIDEPDNMNAEFNARCAEILETVRLCRGHGGPGAGKLHASLDTRNGFHFLTSPFDVGQFAEMLTSKKMEVPDVHKNNPTVLYHSWEEPDK